MAKKKNKNKQKKKDKKAQKAAEKAAEKEAAAKAEDLKAEAVKGDAKAEGKGEPKADAKPEGKKVVKGKAPEKKGKGSREGIQEEKYVSPFSDEQNDDDYGFGEDQAADLANLEHMLNVEVDDDFFAEPRYFHTLRRVINVLGLHIAEHDKEELSGKALLERNPAYQNLQKQARVVEQAIDHMSQVYCNALNRSVIQVGRIAREFDDAIGKVESLRQRLRVIQDTIGNRGRDANQGGNSNDEEGGGDAQEVAAVTPAAQMSLRELWMLKLESEAMLSLIGKINVVRHAPGRFDDLTANAGGTHYTCRIGAATSCLTEALATMFSDEMSQIQALGQILENLMMRQKTAEDIIWETLADILYLRTANGQVLKFEVRDEKQQQKQRLQQKITEGAMPAAKQIVTNKNEDAKLGEKNAAPDTATRIVNKRIYNPFQKNYSLLCVEDNIENDDISIDSQASGDSMDDDKGEGDGNNNNKKDSVHTRSMHTRTKDSVHTRTQSNVSEVSFDEDSVDDDGNKKQTNRMMIPKEVVDAPLDLSVDELKCFDPETKALSQATLQKRYLPRYTDPVLSLRILVDCLVQLGRLHMLEDLLMKNVEAEVKKVFQREQARTFYRLDRRRPLTSTIRNGGKDIDTLKDFRRHFTAVLSSFGCIMMRYSHLAQIARSRIMADEEVSAKFQNPTTFLKSVLDKAYSVMQNELKNFLRACLQEHLSKGKSKEATLPEESAEKKKIFSFGVLEGDGEEKKGKDKEEAEIKSDSKQDKKQEPKAEPEPEVRPEEEAEVEKAPKFSEMSASTFVSSVLFPMTNTTPQIQHALIFRRSMDRFTKINEKRTEELALASGEPYRAVKTKSEREELAIEFLDKAIKDNVLPSLQTEAVNGAIIACEMADAFDPPTEANVYARADKIQPLDVAMVSACEGVMDKTQPLFMAIHRLPPGGVMYQEQVKLLEFLVSNFVEKVEQKIKKFCEETTSEELLEGLGENQGKLAAAFGKRNAFVMLLKAYELDLDLMDDTQVGLDEGGTKNVDGEGADGKETPEKGSKPAISGDVLPEKGIQREEALLKLEMEQLADYLDFLPYHQETLDYDLIPKKELKQVTCLAHSILKLSSILEGRLKSRQKGSNKLLVDIEILHENIKQLKASGMKLAKFCHMEVLLQVIYKMATICNSTTLCAPDAVRVPTSVNGVAEWLTGTMDYLREGTSNAMAAYTFSNLGQYIPACLMSTVRVVAAGEGIVLRAPLTMNGIESLDRSAAVLYKDLKSSTGFQSKFFNIQATALAFERAATFTALMEMSIGELAEYYTTHSQSEEFSDTDYELMFRMDGPRRRGDEKQFKKLKNVIKKRKKEKEEKKEAGQQATAS